VNKLLKMHRGMADMMKAMGGAKRGPLAGLANALGFGGMPSQEELAKLAEKMPGGTGAMPTPPGGLPGAPPAFPGLPGGLPGLGGPKGPGLPGLGGFPGLRKKK
jgi:signal recognition particle subunit SRP54